MQIQHIDVFVSSHSAPQEGDYAAPVGESAEHFVPIVGSSEVWDAWICPGEGLAGLSAFGGLSASALEDDSQHIKLSVNALEADQRIGLRIYVLSR
ncbi:MAG: hypothetical protein JSS66_03260 [Armatimonadetes bacterium]|nr:hypothetical protein [Armatimonadota bacterium]